MTAMSRRVFGVFAGLGLALLAGCNVDLENMEAPGLAKDKDAAAREVYQAFRSGDLTSIRPRFAPEMQGPQAEAALPQIIALIPKTEPTKARLASWNLQWDAGTGGRTENLVTKHEYTYPDVVVLAETVMARQHAGGKPGPWMIRGFHVKRNPVGAPAAATASDAPPQPAPAASSNEFITPEQAAAEASAAPSGSDAPNNRR